MILQLRLLYIVETQQLTYNTRNKRRNKIKRYYTYVTDDNEFKEVECWDRAENVGERVIVQETMEIVYKYLQQLTQEHRDVIVLGYTNVPSARVLHIFPNAVGLR